MTPELREGWAELLGRYHWDVFATLTYASPVWAAEKVARDFRRWLYRWQAVTAEARGMCRRVGESPAGEPTYRGSWVDRYNRGCGAVWVLGIEQHRSGALHAHGLIAWNPKLADLRWEVGGPLWFRPKAEGGFGHGFVKLEAPRTQSDVAWYVAKYMVKDGEIVLSPSFKAARLACA